MLETGPLLSRLALWFEGLLASLGFPSWVAVAVEVTVAFGLVLALVLVMVLFLVWWLRKVSGDFQQRLGPVHTGPWGVLQTLADGLKIMQKEDIVPISADRRVFFWAPVVMFTASVAAFAVIPFGLKLTPASINIGVLYVFAITTFTVIALFMAGWGSNNKYALLGGFRSVAQVIAYEVPMALAILGVVILAGSLSMDRIVAVQTQTTWFIVKAPIAFLIYLIAGTAEINWTPFDLPEAEQELVSGFNVEYSGMKFALFFLAEFANAFLISAIAVTIFLGGWHDPVGLGLPSWLWFMGKTLAVVFLLMWFRWTFPRVRVDQLTSFAWKFLLPLAFANVVLMAGLMQVWPWYAGP
jgi:NADH-quinone oxidoreductase subunit H